MKLSNHLNLQSSSSRAFSLIELLVVLTIVSLLMAFGAGQMTGVVSSLDLTTASEDVSTIFKRAKRGSSSSQ